MSPSGPSVVVGGGSGIGAALARRRRAAGNEVVVWDVAGEHDVTCDLAEPAQIDAATAATLALVGVPASVDITAGIGHSAALATAPSTDWDRVMAVNARGPWLVMRALAGPMAGAGGGSIVAVSSVSGRLVDRSMGLYCASKAALDMIVKVAAAEWAPAVRVNAVAPGVTDTPMLGPTPRDGTWLTGVARRTALGRLGTAEDVAEAVLGLHDLHWVTGQVLECDGGLGLRSPISPPAVP
jgi:NAD(P)-dependent dehydrogenase (short-subunit alcohol dehydrogenase family)